MVHSVFPAPKLWNLLLVKVSGSSFPFLRTEAQLASQDPAPCCWSVSLSPSGCLSLWIPWAVSLGICVLQPSSRGRRMENRPLGS